MATTVVNVHRKPYDVYIGRTPKWGPTTFGNPYKVSVFGNQAIAMYTAWFLKEVEVNLAFRHQVLALKDKILGCHCDPSACHGHVMRDWIEANHPANKEIPS